MMLLGLFCLSGPSWAEAAFPEGEPQQSYTGSLLITAKEGDADSQSGVNPLATFEGGTAERSSLTILVAGF